MSWPGEPVRISTRDSSPTVHFSTTLAGFMLPEVGQPRGWRTFSRHRMESLRFYQELLSVASPALTLSAAITSWDISAPGFATDFRGHFFVRPEADVYLINNNQEFSSSRHALRRIPGYSFTPGF